MTIVQTVFSKPVFIVNPNSAAASTRREWPEIEKLARAVFPSLEVKYTQRTFEAPALTRDALRAGSDLIVSVGGDGTHNEVVNGFFDGDALVRPGATLGVLSRGTGGDFRRTLGLMRCRGGDTERAVGQLASATRVPCDVGKLTFLARDGSTHVRRFINIASFGIGGEIDERVNQSSKALGGTLSFLLATLAVSSKYANRRVRVSVDGNPFFEGPMYNIAVANGKYFGGGMKIAPHAEISDGLFDVVACGDLSFFEALRMATRIYDGKHLDLPKIRSTRGKQVIAESDETVLLDVDGEAPGKLRAVFDVLPSALHVLRL